MSISYNGIGQLSVTIGQEGCAEGAVCKLNAEGVAVGCGNGERPCGVVLYVDAELAAVLMEGFARVSYSGTMPSCGWCGLSANGNGGVKVDSTGASYLVVEVDELANTCVIKF